MAKPFNECTVEELNAKAKLLKTLLGVTGTLLCMIVGYMIYRISRADGFQPAGLIGGMVAVLGGMITSWSALARITAEKNSRQSKPEQTE